MHSFYLRSLYMRNELVTGELELAGQRLSLSSVTSDTYAVGAINDHIVPWHGSYKTGGLMGGKTRYVLSSGGHIAGIVNPPGPKAWYEAGDYAGPARTPGAPRPASTRAHGGKTGPRGLTPGPERTSSRRPWAANGTPPSATPPASTYAAETWTGGSPLKRDREEQACGVPQLRAAQHQVVKANSPRLPWSAAAWASTELRSPSALQRRPRVRCHSAPIISQAGGQGPVRGPVRSGPLSLPDAYAPAQGGEGPWTPEGRVKASSRLMPRDPSGVGHWSGTSRPAPAHLVPRIAPGVLDDRHEG
jgi:hypothetical protein